ncbi:MAG: virulence factor BrkB family protein [Litorilituus sp.]|jgi:membrane protein|nr:virulence factor BrkB family protein [Litorilituus sp.]
MSHLQNILKSTTYSLALRHTLSFLHYLRSRLTQEQLNVVAGYLSYVSLMSLVPLMVVALSVATAFPIFADIHQSVEQFVYNNFVPTASGVVQQYLSSFVANASKMSAVALSFLFLVALLLISAIDKTLNKIWKTTKKRRIITSFSMYWMILTLGPILVGGSIAITSYIVSLVSLGVEDSYGLSNLFFRLLPLLSSMAAFVLLYMLVPNKAVPFKFALTGAFVAAIFFELAKKSFALYLTAFPSYQAIYGALAIIPILFLWVYLSWIIVLTGAIITVSLQEYQLENAGLEENVNEKDKQ